jgi:hypothetical protein
MNRPTPGPLDPRHALRWRQLGLRQGVQDDTMEAIAPDAAALRSRQCRKADGLRFVLDVT